MAFVTPPVAMLIVPLVVDLPPLRPLPAVSELMPLPATPVFAHLCRCKIYLIRCGIIPTLVQPWD